MNITFELYVPGSWDGISESHPGLAEEIIHNDNIQDDELRMTDDGPITRFGVVLDVSSPEDVYEWSYLLEQLHRSGLKYYTRSEE